jgi:predicted sugar kinase
MKYIPVGTVTNRYERTSLEASVQQYSAVTIKFPSRLNAMAIDPSRIAVVADGCYNAGEVVFAVGLCKRVSVNRDPEAGIMVVSPDSKRPVLIDHAVRLMRDALGFTDGLRVSVDNQSELRHVGLGSSSGLIASVGAAINELYGRPFRDDELLRYLAQNHVEEVDGTDQFVTPVQCLGGAGAAGLYEGSVLVVAGENTVVAQGTADEDYAVVIGVPADFVEKDAAALMEAELKAIPKFIKTGKTFGPQIAYRVFHEMLPAIARGQLGPVGDVVFDYRFNMGSIENCSFVYNDLQKIADQLRVIRTLGLADVLALSSVGPGFFVVTKQPSACADIMTNAGLRLIRTKLFNSRYEVLERSA